MVKKVNNNFDFVKLREYYECYETCRYCGKSQASAFHHVISKREPYTGSILNATPLHNYTCHINIHGKLMQRKQQEEFFLGNVKYLLSNGYQMSELDRQYIERHGFLEILKKA